MTEWTIFGAALAAVPGLFTCILDTWSVRICILNTVQKQYFLLLLNLDTFSTDYLHFYQWCCHSLGHWSLVVKDKILVLGPVLGFFCPRVLVLALALKISLVLALVLRLWTTMTKAKDNITPNCCKCKRCEWHFRIFVTNLILDMHDDDQLTPKT